MEKKYNFVNHKFPKKVCAILLLVMVQQGAKSVKNLGG